MRRTPLAEKIARRIEAEGPISVAEYMAICLGDPDHGYYVTRDPLGAAGDFVTAPEISQIFGEILGAWFVQMWRMTGSPSPVRLVELGPGRGTLMADMLRLADRIPAFREARSLHLVETSPALRARQAERLAGHDPVWHDRLEDVPEGPVLLVANEFFDALPVRQYVADAQGWRERVVGLAAEGALAFGLGPGTLDAPPAPEGEIREVSPASDAIMAEIAGRIASSGGAALIVDYGHAGGFGDTFQAVRGHAYADPLEAPGEADLTAHVDFAALAARARAEGATPFGPLSQGRFLTAFGLFERAAQLSGGRAEAEAAAIGAGAERLASPAEMGALFKVLAVVSSGVVPPPFAPQA